MVTVLLPMGCGGPDTSGIWHARMMGASLTLSLNDDETFALASKPAPPLPPPEVLDELDAELRALASEESSLEGTYEQSGELISLRHANTSVEFLALRLSKDGNSMSGNSGAIPMRVAGAVTGNVVLGGTQSEKVAIALNTDRFGDRPKITFYRTAESARKSVPNSM